MTTQKVNNTLKGAATIWQLLFSLGSTIVVVTVFVLSIRGDVNAAKKDIERHEKLIERMSNDIQTGQREILDAINDLKLQLKDKQDRNN